MTIGEYLSYNWLWILIAGVVLAVVAPPLWGMWHELKRMRGVKIQYPVDDLYDEQVL